MRYNNTYSNDVAMQYYYPSKIEDHYFYHSDYYSDLVSDSNTDPLVNSYNASYINYNNTNNNNYCYYSDNKLK